MKVRSVCILGGTGFIGRHLANRLHAAGKQVKVLTRRRQRARHMLVIPGIELVECNVHDPTVLEAQFQGVDAVINLVGILNEHGKKGEGFRKAHVTLAENVAKACKAAGVKRLQHMCANGAAKDAPSLYQQTKAEGEARVFELAGDELCATSYRPSVIFGREDAFLNRFSALLKLPAPFFPLPTPDFKLAPVCIGDVVDALEQTLEDDSFQGKAIAMCGPKTYRLIDLVRYVRDIQDICRPILPCGPFLSKMQARVLGMIPTKPYSMDNYLSSTVDNICAGDSFASLDIHPQSIESVVPFYMGDHQRQARYDEMRREAQRR